jgi:hypothetical protein
VQHVRPCTHKHRECGLHRRGVVEENDNCRQQQLPHQLFNWLLQLNAKHNSWFKTPHTSLNSHSDCSHTRSTRQQHTPCQYGAVQPYDK